MFLGCLLVFLMRTVSARRLLPFRLAGGKLALGALVPLVQTAAMLLRPARSDSPCAGRDA